MPKAVLKNNREHDININFVNPQTQEVGTVNVPGARPHPMDANQMVAGEALVEDDASVKMAIKKYPVVKSYFDNGWLEWAKSLTVEAAPAE